MKKPERKRRRKIAAALLFLPVFFLPFRKYGKVISANDCDPFLSRNGKYISLCSTPPDPKAMTRQKKPKLVAAVSVDPRRDISPGFFGYSYIRRASAAKKRAMQCRLFAAAVCLHRNFMRGCCQLNALSSTADGMFARFFYHRKLTIVPLTFVCVVPTEFDI